MNSLSWPENLKRSKLDKKSKKSKKKTNYIPEVWGCEFISEGTPCVAQRVCAIPEWTSWIPESGKFKIIISYC